MAIKLTSGAMEKIMSGKCDVKPVLQVIYIDKKQWSWVGLSDGSFKQVGFISEEILLSKKLQKGSIVQLNKFSLVKGRNDRGEIRSNIRVSDLTVIQSKCDIIGDPKLYPHNETHLVEKNTSTIPEENHANSHYVEEPPTSIQEQDHVDLHENIDGSCHVEEPPTLKQKTPASTQKCSFHSLTLNQTNTIMGVNLTPGAITKIMTDNCSSTDLKPVVQVTYILIGRIRISNIKDKRCYRKVVLSDGSSSHFGCIIDDIFISKKLQKGSIIQLTKFRFTKFSTYGDKRVLLINDVNVIHNKCDIVVNPEALPHNDIPLVERSTPPVADEDHADITRAQESVTSTQNCSENQSRKRKHQSSNEHPEPDTNEDVDNSHSSQEPSATTQRCSSLSLTQSKKRKHRSSNNSISKVVSKMVRMMIEKNKEDDVGSCFKKLETLEKDISKMARTMMEKNQEVDVGFKKLDALKEDVSKMTRTMMEKNKQDDVGACFKKLETLEQDVSEMKKMMMEKNKEYVVGLKKLETLKEDVFKLMRMMMEKNKEDDMGACIEKLDRMGWGGAEEPMYDTALLLFGQSADYRKLWLHLKPECCGKWVKNAGNMFGLLD